MNANDDALHLKADQLESGFDHIRRAPKDTGVLEMIVRRPEVGAREVLTDGRLDPAEGLEGDNWKARGRPNPEMQLNVMSARVVGLLAQTRERWALAGDQLFVDLDLSQENLPVGTRLGIGAAVIEITAPPHTGCAKFMARFGVEALKFVNSPAGKQLRMRGLNAKVVQPGAIRAGDRVAKIA